MNPRNLAISYFELYCNLEIAVRSCFSLELLLMIGAVSEILAFVPAELISNIVVHMLVCLCLLLGSLGVIVVEDRVGCRASIILTIRIKVAPRTDRAVGRRATYTRHAPRSWCSDVQSTLEHVVKIM
jgi:hypothetical protein